MDIPHETYVIRSAQLEMKVVLTRLAQRLEMQLLDPEPEAVKGHRSHWAPLPGRVREKGSPVFFPLNRIADRGPCHKTPCVLHTHRLKPENAVGSSWGTKKNFSPNATTLPVSTHGSMPNARA